MWHEDRSVFTGFLLLITDYQKYIVETKHLNVLIVLTNIGSKPR